MNAADRGRDWRHRAWAALLACALAAGLMQKAGAAEDSTVASLAVGNNADGRLEVFQVDRNGELHHRWQRESLHDWSSWASLGGHFQPGVAVVHDLAGRLGVFAVDRTTMTVEYKFQKAPNSPAWSNWCALGGQTVLAPVASGRDPNGALEIFAVGADDHSVKYIWQTGAGGDWSEWTDLGGSLEAGLLVARNLSGHLEVFGIDTRDQSLVHCWQTSADTPSPWSPWAVLAERIQPGFVVEQNADGRLEAFGVSAVDGQVGHAFQRAAAPDAPWSPWVGLRAQMKPKLAAGINRDGRIEIFSLSRSNGMIFHDFQTRAGSTSNWSGWTDMSLLGGLNMPPNTNAAADWARLTAMGAISRSCPATGNDVDGRLEIFALDERLDGVVNHRRQISGNLNWADWTSLDRSASQYISRAWRLDDGLPDNRVQAIAQTPDGYLWIGTLNGLARFDGVHFAPIDLSLAFGLANPPLTCLFVDHDGALWIGSDGAGLARLCGGQSDHYGKSDGLAGDSITVISQASDRSIWIGTTAGLSHYQAGKFSSQTPRHPRLADSIRSILEDSEGYLWVATDKGLARLKGKEIRLYSQTNGLPDNAVNGLWQDVPSRLWIGSHHGLIFWRGGGFYSYGKDFGLTDRIVNVIRNDSQGDIWVGTDSGLNRFQEGTFFEMLDQEGSSFGKINTLFVDREANLWIGSQDGLFLLTSKRILVYGKHQGLTQNNITSVVEDNGGNLWIGTSGGGVDQRNGETVTAFSPDTGFPLDLVTSLCHGRDGSLWVGGDADEGLAQMKGGAVTRYSRTNGLVGGTVRVIHEDRSGNLWVGTTRGLGCLTAAGFSTNTICQMMAGVPVRDICEDQEGCLWFGTARGLNRWQDGRCVAIGARNGLSDNVVTALYADEDHSLWIGTEKGGLNRFHNGRFTAYSARDGLYSNEILEIIEDDFGWLWMSCSKGVFRVRKKDLDAVEQRKAGSFSSVTYGHDDGMESVLCSPGKPGGWKTRDGELWFPTSAGLVAIDPRVINPNTAPPPVYIEQLVAGRLPLPTAEYTASPARISPGHSELEFHYTALSFQRPERMRFKYKLDGVNPDWVDAGTRRVAYYNNLSPGPYTFHVIACNSDGVWNEKGAALALVLLPYFWETWWSRLLAVSVVLGIVAAAARQITRKRMQRRLKLLEQQNAVEKERMRIARDIHDDLGGSLTQITFLGEMAMRDLAKPAEAAVHVNKITDSARQTVRALDEIVWAVRPENDRLDHLTLYLWQFAEEFFGPTQVRCRVEAPPDVPPCFVPAEVRHGIYLVVKEAFNNTLKHAGATEVRLRFAFHDSTLSIAIEDNGKGFRTQPADSLHDGLANMKKRVEEFHGQFSIASAAGQGTQLKFSIPLKNGHPH